MRIYFDGSPALQAVAVYDDNICKCYITQLSDDVSNNEAEYYAAIEALKYAQTSYPDADVTLYGDSQLVIRQLTGIWKIKEFRLKALYDQYHNIAIKPIPLKWIRRAHNKAGVELEHILHA